MNSQFDKEAARLIDLYHATGVRVVVSKGSVNSWHAYIEPLGLGHGPKRFYETGRHADFFDAIAELEELLAKEQVKL